MRKRLISIACWLAGIVIVVALYIGLAMIEMKWLLLPVSIIAALDARWARVWRYESEIARSPGTLLILMLLFGWLFLPWYVGLRLKILTGTVDLKEEYRWTAEKNPDLLPYPVSKGGLLQPWNRK